MKRCNSGEIVLSSVEMAYQLGIDRQAACVVFPEKRVSENPSLHGVEDAGLRGLDIAGEIPKERFLAQLREAARRDEAGAGRRRRELGSERGVVLAGVRRTSSDVDKGRDWGSTPASLMTVPEARSRTCVDQSCEDLLV